MTHRHELALDRFGGCLELSPQLVVELRRWRARRGEDDVTRAHDAFLLDPGLGPATYLTIDGRVAWDDDGWNVKATGAKAFSAIRSIGKTGVALLADLLPKRRRLTLGNSFEGNHGEHRV